MGIPLKRGRYFTDADGLNGSRAAVISEMMARRLWPGQDAVGRQIQWGADASRAPWMPVVGVAGDVQQGAINTEIIPHAHQSSAPNGASLARDTLTAHDATLPS